MFISRFLLIGLIYSVLTACGLTTTQKVAISKFSGATIVLGDITSNEFAQSRMDLIEINKQRVILGDEKVKNLDGKFTVNLTKVRIQSAMALKKYGEFLAVLAVADQSEEIKKASDAFVTSLQNVKGVSLSQEQLGAIGSAIQFSGSLFLEYKRKNALEEIINETSPALNSLLSAVTRSFSPDDEAWSLVYDHSLAILERKIAMVDKKANNIFDKAIVARAKNLYKEKNERFHVSSMAIIDATKKVALAESELKEIMTNDALTLSEIDQYLLKVEELTRIIEILSK